MSAVVLRRIVFTLRFALPGAVGAESRSDFADCARPSQRTVLDETARTVTGLQENQVFSFTQLSGLGQRAPLRSIYLQGWPACIFWKQAYQSWVMIC